MSAVPKGYQLTADDRDDPIVWITKTSMIGHRVAVHDDVVEGFLGAGTSRRLKSFGHDEQGVHFLLMRGGTILHTDKAYTRYAHHLVLRNDGTRIRGLEDQPQDRWHIPMTVGVMYCLDTHSPHQGLKDPRMNPVPPLVKIVLSVDRPEPLEPAEAMALFKPLLETQMADWDTTARPIRA